MDEMRYPDGTKWGLGPECPRCTTPLDYHDKVLAGQMCKLNAAADALLDPLLAPFERALTWMAKVALLVHDAWAETRAAWGREP